jgi:hypothetical protein
LAFADPKLNTLPLPLAATALTLITIVEKQQTGKVKHPKINIDQVWIFVAGAKGTDRECLIPLGTNGYRNKNESTQQGFFFHLNIKRGRKLNNRGKHSGKEVLLPPGSIVA